MQGHVDRQQKFPREKDWGWEPQEQASGTGQGLPMCLPQTEPTKLTPSKDLAEHELVRPWPGHYQLAQPA